MAGNVPSLPQGPSKEQLLASFTISRETAHSCTLAPRTELWSCAQTVERRCTQSRGNEKPATAALRDEARGFSTIEAAAVLSQGRKTFRSTILRCGDRGSSSPASGHMMARDGGVGL